MAERDAASTYVMPETHLFRRAQVRTDKTHPGINNAYMETAGVVRIVTTRVCLILFGGRTCTCWRTKFSGVCLLVLLSAPHPHPG